MALSQPPVFLLEYEAYQVIVLPSVANGWPATGLANLWDRTYILKISVLAVGIVASGTELETLGTPTYLILCRERWSQSWHRSQTLRSRARTGRVPEVIRRLYPECRLIYGQ